MNTGPVLHHCQIIHDQYLQSQTPTIGKHSLTTYISFTVSGQTQSNKLVYWETRICWNIENIFWSHQWPSTNKLLWKTNKNLRVICRKSRRSWILASSSGLSTRMTNSTGEDGERRRRKKILLQLFFQFAAASSTVCQRTEGFTTQQNIAGCREGGGWKDTEYNLGGILNQTENIWLGSG